MSERAIRVLNVNDREIPRYVNEEMLKREGYEVTSVAFGYDALAAVDTGDYDVAVLDVQLPDVDGFEICRRIKGNPKTAPMIVLLTSATFVATKNKVRGLDAGADGYLAQPYEAAELVATLRSLLRLRNSERRAQALADELRASIRVRDEFLAMLGHELRNPLAAVTSALAVIQRDRRPQVLDHHLKVLNRQTATLDRIVGDLLDVARLQRGKVSIEHAKVDLRDLALRCTQALAEEIRASGHRLELDVPDAPIVVTGDLVRLEQVLANLVTNAIKYTPRGGYIRVGVSRAAGHAFLEVTDDGIGLSPAMQQHVFDVFVQGKQSIDRSRGGLGLGLAVVRQLVELHGGTVSAESPGEGKGSTFLIQLPIAPDELEFVAPVEEDTMPGVEPSALRIVLIEDNDDARETLADALGQFHHDVQTAPDGLAGLDLVLDEKPDVALVDIGLPGLDGYEVARQIRARMNGNSPRLIAMTGYGQPDDRQRAAEAGFDMHIVKPVSLKNLRRVLANIEARPH